MLDEHNPLAKVFRMTRDRFKGVEYVHVHSRLIGTRQCDGRQYNLPTASEVAALIVGDGRQSCGNRNVIGKVRESASERWSARTPGRDKVSSSGWSLLEGITVVAIW
ncbi:hypothetical protein RJ639_004559 [Escallonia herrerae]|uniref:Uncharacterized protein n=1 Tax=Escallonia herrerae TaxID=1293975 RepID=A0AA88W2K2_9ASTE|nr:hypothetical protein RJ639_004559 [Escallonia herrerae]